MRIALLSCCLAVGVGAGVPRAAAFDFDRHTVPGKFVEPLLPEEGEEPSYPAYFGDLDKAKAQLAAGRYKHALVTARKLGDAPEALVIRLRALAALGRFDEAKAAFAKQANPTAPQRAAHTEALLAARQYREALAAAKEAVAADEASVAARFLLGQALEAVGDLDAARAAYQWFVDKPQEFLGRWNALKEQDPAFATADDTVTIARALDRFAGLSGAYRDNPLLDQQIFGMYVRAYDVIDRGSPQAHVAAAEYLLSHDKREEAVEELKIALRANGSDGRALGMLGEIALRGFNFDGADQAADAMRDADPAGPAADVLEARGLILQRRPTEAERPVRRVLAKHPDDVEALGLLAATYALRLLDEPMRQTLARVDELDAGNATAYLEVAAALGAQRQYPRAAEMYKVAIDRQPNWIEPRNGLGLLYTQSGDEDDARRELEAARALDPFNIATTNYLRLLDQMASYARRETEHFTIVYDPAADPIIADYFAEYLESIYKDVTGNFRHEPAAKTIIEVFPTHDMFSVRTTGSPWIGTVGASTGRVIALVAPRAGERTMGPFNWAQVLRHEFTHTVTLSATDNRIQHWMTEGLAVVEERVPVRWEWVPMLVNAVKKDELFPLDKLTWGFVRPKRPIDRQLAYAQSAWVCTYLEQKYGRDAVLQMVEAFRNAGRMEDVFPKVTGRSTSEFFEDFKAWAKAQVDAWGYDEETSKKYDALREKGEELITAKQYAEAVPVWEEIRKLRPADALPHQRLAGLYLAKPVDEPAKAIPHLEALHTLELKDNRYAKRIARLYKQAGDLPKAKQFATESVYVNPYDASAHKILLDVCEAAGDEAGAAKQRRAIETLEKLAEQLKAKQEKEEAGE